MNEVVKSLKKEKQVGRKANGRKGNKRKGSGLRKGGSASSKNGESSSRSKSVSGSKPASSQGDFEFPIEDLPSVELPLEKNVDRETPTDDVVSVVSVDLLVAQKRKRIKKTLILIWKLNFNILFSNLFLVLQCFAS